MRAVPVQRVFLGQDAAFASLRFGWLQAGFGSFAYRLAHLRIPRGAAVGGLTLFFLLV